MLVDVVCLRRDGRRLSNEEVKAAAPTRGRLVVKTRHALNQHGETARTADATFEPLPGQEALRRLDWVRVSTIQGDSIMVAGTEIWNEKRMSSSFQCPQTWWCRLVRDRSGG